MAISFIGSAQGTTSIQSGGTVQVNPQGREMTMALGGVTLVGESQGGGLGTIRMGFGLGIEL